MRKVLHAGASAAVAVGLVLGCAAAGATTDDPAASVRSMPGTASGAGAVQAWQDLGPFGTGYKGAPMAAGRIEDIAQDPFNGSRYLALADSGLWVSTDRAASWRRLSGLDRFGEWNFEHGTIAFDPNVRGVVLLVSPFDHRRPTQVGVYRSTDGGQIWQPAINSRPACSDGSIGAPSVVVFRGDAALAAGGCSVGRSTDDGDHWTWAAPDNGGGFAGVAFDSVGNRFACGTDGIFRQTVRDRWNRVVDFTASSWPLGAPTYLYDWGTCRITASPARPNHVFVAARWTNLPSPFGALSDVAEAYSGAGGWHTQDLNGGGHPNGRDVLVETRPDATTGAFDLYWGTTDAVQFQPCTNDAGFECTPGTTHDENLADPPWTNFGQGSGPHGMHADVTRILFSSVKPYCVDLVSNDGGIQRPDPGNCDGTKLAWTYSDKGISAVEFYETALTSVLALGRPAVDLYGASQDNDAFVRLDGSDWAHVAVNGDGDHIAATRRVNNRFVDSDWTFYSSDGNPYFASRGLSNRRAPADGNTLFTAPCKGYVSKHQLDQTPDNQEVMACATASGASLYTTANSGDTWTAVPHSSVTGRPGDRSGVSVYATRTAGGGSGYVVRIGGALWRVNGTSAPVRMLPTWDVGPIDVSSDGGTILTFACPPSPATCQSDGRVRVWTASSGTWHDSAAATSLLDTDSNGNRYWLDHFVAGFSTDGEMAAAAIDPQRADVMAIGTQDLGLLLSSDRGNSWQRLPVPTPNITGLWFDEWHRLFVGTYGRGMSGAVQPTPAQLHETVKTVRVDSKHVRVRWTATLRTSTGAPISGAVLRFYVRSATGNELEMGHVTTDANGRVSSSRVIPRGAYVLFGQWDAGRGQTLVTDEAA